MIKTLEWQHDRVVMIDQRYLPHEEKYVTCYTAEDVAKAIQDMVIRGAPAIGVAAAMGMALAARALSSRAEATRGVGEGSLLKNILSAYECLYKSRPTAVNLKWGLDQMKQCFEKNRHLSNKEISDHLEKEALKIYEEDIAINKAMGNHGKQFIQNHFSVMTYCNAGSLATAGYGTALGVFRAAKEEGKKFSVYVCETRPYLQGLRLTSWELYKENIPQTVIADNMAATLMAQKKINAIFVGADRIAKNGDTANKIGTYNLAVLAKHHEIPFYVVAPQSTFDLNCENGSHIPIEERSAKEITHIQGKAIGLEGIKVYNPAFDVTPAHLINAIITEKGIIKPVPVIPRSV